MSAESGPVFRKHPKKGRFFVGRKETVFPDSGFQKRKPLPAKIPA